MKSKHYRPVYFLPANLLPVGFRYPESWQQFAASGKTHVGEFNYDWCVLDEDDIEPFLGYARKIVPGRCVIPFMRRNGEDGVVCFDGESSNDEPKVWSFNYCVDIGGHSSDLTFSEWAARFPPYDAEEE